ncbi:magnesium transporter [Thiopseudomonas alkaliphila]|uniref:magnesium transporter n=1 Tax=Thiopseudomonas alkaliphila TaxID=1697053 RepID=UPI00069F1FC3|nr:magnesium transporter [Thiopseudomonas alkaliphila]AKX51184.1 magnesium transporter [Thiopseudomonas alkaliphila]AKX53547.1 magnesium transporter [Thiopseudomonas alkaliphila]AKX57541.1 magnesium transporter [Thiopseudomonas alkaliphila]
MSNTNSNLALVLNDAIKNDQFENALIAVKGIRPVDLADVLSQIEASLAWRLLERLPNRATVFSYLEPETQVRLAREFPRASLAKLVGEMPADERTDLFKHFDQSQRDALLPALAQAEREDIRKLSAYVEGTAGALMTSDYATLGKDMSVAEALAALRVEAPDAETIYHAYVIDQQRKLLGVVSLRELILSNPEALIKDLMVRDPIHSKVTDDQEEVAKKIARYDLIALPITDEKGAMVGIVTHDDAMDVASDEATEDFHRAGGVVSTVGNLKDATIGLLYRKRVFWLVLLVFGNLFSGAGIAHFEDIIAANLVLVFFLPLLVDSGGNAGSQSATLMVRALATGEVVMRDWMSLLGRETLVALCLGGTMALAVSILGYIRGDEVVALVLALSMVSIVLIGCLIGMSLPFVLSKMGFDPASASAPLITSVCDAAGVVIYLFIASQFLTLG